MVMDHAIGNMFPTFTTLWPEEKTGTIRLFIAFARHSTNQYIILPRQSLKYHTTLFKVPYHPLQSTIPPVQLDCSAL